MATVTGLCDCVSCAIRRTTVRRAISLKRDRRAGCASCAEHLSVVRPNCRGARLDRPPKMDPGVRAHSWWMSAGSWTRLEVHVRPGSFDFAFDVAFEVAFDFDSPDPERTLM